jgi:hypothetical protein
VVFFLSFGGLFEIFLQYFKSSLNKVKIFFEVVYVVPVGSFFTLDIMLKSSTSSSHCILINLQIGHFIIKSMYNIYVIERYIVE